MKTPKEPILIFCSREICYCSGNFFAHQLGAAFEELGFEAEVCEFTREDDFDQVLEPLTGNAYRAIVDFNSLLPRLEMEDGTPFLEQLKGPFFDYVLDHPLFHYNALVREAENFHAIVLDEGQKEYVRRYHPHLAGVHMMPLGATEALFQGEKLPADKVLFMGTYDSPEAVYPLVQEAPEPLKTYMKHLIERRISEPTLPMEEAFRHYLKEQDLEFSDADFSLLMNAMYPVDAYIRDYFRKAAVDELLERGVPVLAVGEGWQKYRHARECLLTREKSVSFERSFEKIAREQILLNVSPMFNRGLHDRVLAGMANHTVVLTDENPYLQKHLKNRETAAFYSLHKIETLADFAEELLEDRRLREHIAEQAYLEFSSKHTWRHRAEQILSWTE